MAATQQLGAFKLTSPNMVVTDPGNDEQTAKIDGLGCSLSPCALGEWHAELILDRTSKHSWNMPRTVLAIHTDYPAVLKSPNWNRVGSGIGGDSGLIGLHDLAHFHDVRLVPRDQEWTNDGQPADPSDLWYSFVCETIRDRDAAVIPHGLVISWDGGMDVDAVLCDKNIVAIRLTISGWPDRV